MTVKTRSNTNADGNSHNDKIHDYNSVTNN